MHGNQRQAIQYAYIAGIIDGEGSFIILKRDNLYTKKTHKLRNPYYIGGFCIGMVEKQPIELISSIIGKGKVYEECVPNKRSIWRIRCMGNQLVRSFLDKIMPYLIVKKPQAELLYDFLSNWEIPYRRSEGISEKELQRREEAYQKMRKLNAVGAAATTEPICNREVESTV